MNAQTKVEAQPHNLRIWDALSKSDPRHTKGFSRAGGFKGTALKPIWIVQRLTEQFGPCGEGWGVGRPTFEVVPGNGEMLVYCTAECWHGSPENVLYGVGGDKVVGKNKNGLFCDDEAFKKAFTDAIGNAFKFIGIGADIHSGRFEDSKYVDQITREFEDAERPKIDAKQLADITKLLPKAGKTQEEIEAAYETKLTDFTSEQATKCIRRLEQLSKEPA